METVLSVRGKNKVVERGFIYIKNKVLADNTIVYECQLRRRGECNAKIHVLDEVIVRRMHGHHHAPDNSEVEVTKVRNVLKRVAVSTEEPPIQILANNTLNMSEEAASKMPRISVLCRTIRKQRQVVVAPRPLPENLAALVVHDEFQITTRGEQFLRYDSNNEDLRVLIFATDETLGLLERSDCWFCDGTFKVVPELFYQLYTVHVLQENFVIPCVYALLPNKAEATYDLLFAELRNIRRDLNPGRIMTDFEIAAINSLRRNWPNAILDGCFFHLSQLVYKRVQNEGLLNIYRENEDFSRSVKMLAALAFVPPIDVVMAFEQLYENVPVEAHPIMNSFEDNFIGTLRGRGNNTYREQARFPIPLWNIFGRVNENLPRTNNFVEAWHRGFQVRVGISHPNIWKFLNFLKKEESLNHVRITQMIGGHEPESQRARCRNCTTRIRVIVQNYHNRQIMDYLRGISYNISL